MTLAVFTVVVYGGRWLWPSENIKSYLLGQIRPVLGQDCDIRRVRFGVGTVHFLDIELPQQDQHYSISISDLHFRYNPVRLLFQGLDPETISGHALLNRPRITFYSPTLSTTAPSDLQTSVAVLEQLESSYEEKIKKLRFLKRLSITDGEIVLQENDSLSTMLANGIEGWLYSSNSDTVNFNLTGNLFSSRKRNLKLDGKAELVQGNILAVNLLLSDFPLDEPIPPANSADFTMLGGKMHAALQFRSQQNFADQRRFDLDGRIQIDNASARFASSPIKIEQLNTHGRVRDWQIIFDDIQFLLNGHAARANAKVSNLLYPQIDMDISLSRFLLQDFIGLLTPDLQKRVNGRASAHLQVSGPISDLQLAGNVYANRLWIDRREFNRLVLRAALKNNLMNVQTLLLSALHHDLAANGVIDLNSPQKPIDGRVTIHGSIPFTALGLRTSLDRLVTHVEARLGGTVAGPAASARSKLFLISDQSDSLLWSAELHLKNRLLSIKRLQNDHTPAVEGWIDFARRPVEFDLAAHGLQNLAAWFVPAFASEWITHRLRMTTRLKGNPGHFQLFSDLQRLEGSFYTLPLLRSSIDLKHLGGDWRGTGSIDLHPQSEHPLYGEWELAKTADQMFTHLVFPGEQILFDLKQSADTPLAAAFKLSSLPVNRLLGLPDTARFGMIDGEILVHAHDAAPQVSGDLSISAIQAGNGHSYSSILGFNYDQHRFVLDPLRLDSDQVTLLDASGEYLTLADSLSFVIRGAGFDINHILSPSNNKKALISGQSLIDIRINGPLLAPQVDGVIGIKEGTIYRLPFDELEIRLGGHEQPPAGILPPSVKGITLERIRLFRRDGYSITGGGIVPFAPNDSLHIHLDGEGNFLQIASDLVGYFRNSKSQGKFSAELNGTRIKPRLQRANLYFAQGEMDFGSVVPPVRNVVGDISFLPDSRFLKINKLQGTMGGEWFSISTVRATAEMGQRPLDELEIGSAGVNLGVFVLETKDRGVPLNIRGLMEKDVYGRLQISGRQADEPFVLAGPVERPVLRGTIYTHDFRFMYPFEGGDQANHSVVVEFLRNIDWDIRVRPAEDVRYINTLPGALDNVYVNLLIEEEYGNLDFTGQVDDGTLRAEGRMRSTAGLIEYFDMTFRVQEAGVDFDRGSMYPVVYGEARSTVIDSLGLPSQVILTLQTVDQTMNKKEVDDIVKQEKIRGRWDQIRFKLTTDNPNLGSNEAQILAALGYSTETMQDKAFDAIGISTENILFRPLYRPMERQLENLLNLDYVRFSSRFARNLIASNLNENAELNTRLSLLRSTKIVVGKYLADRLFLQYTGQIEAGIDYRYEEKNIGLRHTLGLEYRINPKLLLELEYDYNSLMYENNDDKRIVLRHWFPF